MIDSEFKENSIASIIPAEDWTPLAFSEIRPGDWLRITISENGVVTVRQGVVHRKVDGQWLTVEGGAVAAEKDKNIVRAPRRKRGWNLLANVASLTEKGRDLARDISTSSLPKLSKSNKTGYAAN